jgi:hypothetical protein
MKSALLRKTWALVFGIASLINCVAQEIDIAYVRIGAPAADGDSIAGMAALVVDLNTGAPSGVHYNLQIVDGLAELEYLGSTNGRITIGVGHGNYPDQVNYSGSIRTKAEGLVADSEFTGSTSIDAFYFCGMITLYTEITVFGVIKGLFADSSGSRRRA